LTDIDFVLTGATFVLFLIFAGVLGKFGWGPLLKIVEEREKTVRDHVEGRTRPTPTPGRCSRSTRRWCARRSRSATRS
jgi:F-type H+-transporting ATPase subunit b